MLKELFNVIFPGHQQRLHDYERASSSSSEMAQLEDVCLSPGKFIVLTLMTGEVETVLSYHICFLQYIETGTRLVNTW